MRFSRFPIAASAFALSAGFAALLLATAPQTARAQAVVPSALTATEGAGNSSTITNFQAYTYQTQIAAAQLTSFTGGQIAGVSFRLDNDSGTPPSTNLTFASYQVTLSQAANSLGNFSTTFASNIGNNAAVVYNNALTFTAASFGSRGPDGTSNAFGPTINFASGYTYQGGDLVITIRHSGNGVASPFLNSTFTNSGQGYGTAIVAQLGSGQNATTANGGQGNAIVARLNSTAITAAAPEPSTLPLVGMGLISGLGILSRKRETLGIVRRRFRTGK